MFSCCGEGGQSWAGREFEANKVETQMMKQRERGGDYVQPGSGSINSSGWSRIPLKFFCFVGFPF